MYMEKGTLSVDKLNCAGHPGKPPGAAKFFLGCFDISLLKNFAAPHFCLLHAFECLNHVNPIQYPIREQLYNQRKA